jgi:hypothetical protein
MAQSVLPPVLQTAVGILFLILAASFVAIGLYYIMVMDCID